MNEETYIAMLEDPQLFEPSDYHCAIDWPDEE